MTSVRRFAKTGSIGSSPYLAALFCVASLFTFTSCSQQNAASAFASTEPVTLGIGLPVQTGQDPLHGAMQASRLLSLEGLTFLARDGRPQPRLAESWTESEDGLTWTIHLRSNAFFHDGSPVDSQAVSQSLKRSLRSPDLYRSPGLLDIVELQTPSPQILSIRLSQRSRFLLDDLTVPITKESPAGSIGTGPFVSGTTSGNELRMNAVSNYYRGKPAIDRVVWKSYAAVRTAWAAMMRGEIDFLYEVAPEAVEFIEPEASVQVFPFLRNYVYLVVFNSKRAHFSDWRVRRALNYAIDRQRLIQQALGGRGQMVSGPSWPQHWAFDASLPNYSFDASRATALLNDANIPALSKMNGSSAPPSRFRFTCLLPENFALWERMALIVQRDLAAIGVDMQIDSVPFETFNKRVIDGDFDAVIMELVVGNTASRPFTFWYSKSTQNVWGFSSHAVDVALDRLRRASSDGEYRDAFRQVQITSLEDPPAIFLALGEVTRAVSKRFRVVAPPGTDIMSSIFDWQPVDGNTRLATN
jgi:peptide/nickel transport system substrate-binding protein